jgi:hypothetical protein
MGALIILSIEVLLTRRAGLGPMKQMERANVKIILAAFKFLNAKTENICEQACRALVAEHPDQVAYEVLDLGPNSEGQLQRALSCDPAGVLLMHEDGFLQWHHYHIEDYAFDLELPLPTNSISWGRGGDDLEMPHIRKISSDFALEAKTALGATGLIEVITSLDAGEQEDPFWCNRAYLHALEWGRSRKRPVVFVRLGIQGTMDDKLVPLRRILDLMMNRFMLNSRENNEKTHNE